MPKPRRPAAPFPPKRPRARERLDVDQRRSQLLALGLSIFSDRSYDEVSVDDLARAAGISKGLLYHYFPTKRDYYVAAIEHAAAQLLEETLTARDLPPEVRVRRGLETYLDFVVRRGAAYAALMRGGIGSDRAVMEILERTRGAFVSRILEDVPRPLTTPLLRVALRGWIGFVEAAAIEWVALRAVSREALLGVATAVLLETLRSASGLSDLSRFAR